MTEEFKMDADVLAHPLMPTFYAAVEQAMSGKGMERHGTTEEFIKQPIFWIGCMTGPRGPMYQVFKKVHEAVYCFENGTFNEEEATSELLGALVYLASIVTLVNSDGAGMQSFTHPEADEYSHVQAYAHQEIDEEEEDDEDITEPPYAIGFRLHERHRKEDR